MLDGITERLKEISEGTFGGEISTKEGEKNDEILFNAVIALGITVGGLLIVIIYCCFKYVIHKEGMEGEDKRMVRPATVLEVEEPPIVAVPPQGQLPEPTIKVRKRSMTFSETDEECRKYREDLADSYNSKTINLEPGERSRKKSTVSFARVEEIEPNES